jgi:hypothetical protein
MKREILAADRLTWNSGHKLQRPEHSDSSQSSKVDPAGSFLSLLRDGRVLGGQDGDISAVVKMATTKDYGTSKKNIPWLERQLG